MDSAFSASSHDNTIAPETADTLKANGEYGDTAVLVGLCLFVFSVATGVTVVVLCDSVFSGALPSIAHVLTFGADVGFGVVLYKSVRMFQGARALGSQRLRSPPDRCWPPPKVGGSWTPQS